MYTPISIYIYTLSTQYLHCIYVHTIYMISTHYLHTIYDVDEGAGHQADGRDGDEADGSGLDPPSAGSRTINICSSVGVDLDPGHV